MSIGPGQVGEWVTLHVCVTCKTAAPAEAPEAPPEMRGRTLHDRLAAAIDEAGLASRIRLKPVECLSVCKRPATVAVSGAGRWTYVWGDIEAERDLQTLIAGVLAYAAAPQGIIPWKERPQIFKSGVIARIPFVGTE